MGKREEVRRRTLAEILETAGRMAETEGWRAVTIRRIAAEIGYSAPVIYQHFPSKGALLHTLLERANGELAERMRASVADEPAARGPHLAAAAYLEFARSRPGLYQLMSGAPGTDVDDSTRRAAAADVIAFTRQLIGAWATEIAAEPPGVEDAGDLLWGTLHGLASIGSIKDIGFDRALRLADQAVTALLGYWSAPTANPEVRPRTVKGEK
ncbi:TetR/AcrR family transcriptional regulator [Streptomyces tsukubensis]|uniref:TetR family transcriptional regulator n=1 Tax=Streptomyces tsukubensis TaxID=83656 RepID=A0A1V4A156_9ACTN|nr:TetR/AcrR family transcriptional regulator [Streptomyces tsukubensis]OON71972.1 TetR family transcriptional regulator [Streptomyces tsukubensis]QFR95720.1 TetR family transcriptional regulator [Streptomyces tsukubensis]